MNLTVYNNKDIVFTSDNSWLHPLFELIDFIDSNKLNPEELYVKDKLIGRGAAVLLVRMGITRCHSTIMSRKATPLLEEYHIEYSYDELVDSLECRTETILTPEMSIEESFQELNRRAGRI